MMVANYLCWIFLSLKVANRRVTGMHVMKENIRKGTGMGPCTEMCFNKISIGSNSEHSITNYEYMQKNENHPTKVAMLLVHGFGANHHHWRSNVPVLAQEYDTYAIDLFGFGNSSQYTEFSYSISFWSSQVVNFIDTVIQRPCILVGNSLGGFVIMNVAAAASASNTVTSSNILGIIPINPLVVSRQGDSIKTPMTSSWYHSKFMVTSYFHYIRKKWIIKQLMKRLYPVFPDRIDEFIIQSIYSAASSKNASEVFYKIMMENIVNPSVFIEDILRGLQDTRVPMLVIYGEKDEWIRPDSTRKHLTNYSRMEWISVDAGHCPQDEIPDRINSLVLDFAAKIVV
jgi:pimeloyl-ACP methyl ester carboxylesterase